MTTLELRSFLFQCIKPFSTRHDLLIATFLSEPSAPASQAREQGARRLRPTQALAAQQTGGTAGGRQTQGEALNKHLCVHTFVFRLGKVLIFLNSLFHRGKQASMN